MYGVARTAVDRARSGGGPSLIEAITYRHGGHSRADPGKYRPDDEVAAWKARDPIPAYRARLVAAGVGEAELDAIDDAARAAVAAAEAEARSGPGTQWLDAWRRRSGATEARRGGTDLPGRGRRRASPRRWSATRASS